MSENECGYFTTSSKVARKPPPAKSIIAFEAENTRNTLHTNLLILINVLFVIAITCNIGFNVYSIWFKNPTITPITTTTKTTLVTTERAPNVFVQAMTQLSLVTIILVFLI